jgi:hypothetical protein
MTHLLVYRCTHSAKQRNTVRRETSNLRTLRDCRRAMFVRCVKQRHNQYTETPAEARQSNGHNESFASILSMLIYGTDQEAIELLARLRFGESVEEIVSSLEALDDSSLS